MSFPSKNLLEFAKFFNTEVPPVFFAMTESPRLPRMFDGTQAAADLVSWMRIFLELQREPMDLMWHREPATALDIPAQLYYNLVMGRGLAAKMEYKLQLVRFDRLPPEMRKECANDVLLSLICEQQTPWYEAVLNRAGHNAVSSMVEWCSH